MCVCVFDCLFVCLFVCVCRWLQLIYFVFGTSIENIKRRSPVYRYIPKMDSS